MPAPCSQSHSPSGSRKDRQYFVRSLGATAYLSGAFTSTNHRFTSDENFETGLWISRNCPALC
jgi:hypothetical protein